MQIFVMLLNYNVFKNISSLVISWLYFAMWYQSNLMMNSLYFNIMSIIYVFVHLTMYKLVYYMEQYKNVDTCILIIRHIFMHYRIIDLFLFFHIFRCIIRWGMYGMLGLFFREFEGLFFFTFYLKDFLYIIKYYQYQNIRVFKYKNICQFSEAKLWNKFNM